MVRIDNGLSTREKEAAELTGLSFNLIASQLNREQKLLSTTTNKTIQEKQEGNDE